MARPPRDMEEMPALFLNEVGEGLRKEGAARLIRDPTEALFLSCCCCCCCIIILPLDGGDLGLTGGDGVYLVRTESLDESSSPLSIFSTPLITLFTLITLLLRLLRPLMVSSTL